jgi:hypothetical protein
MKRNVCGFLFLSIWVAAASFASGAVIPAGTALVARTVDPVSTHERYGALLKAKLEHDVVAQGKVLLRAGTPVIGVVEGSLARPQPKSTVIVNLKSISVNGHNIPVKTTGAYHFPPRFSTKRGVSVSGRETNYPREMRMVFHLAHPLSI